MPYIKPDDADKLITDPAPSTPGELNYCFSLIAANYIVDNGLSYQSINDISGALTEALAEFRRRIVVPYEDVKRKTGVDPYEDIRPHTHGPSPDEDWLARLSGKN